MHSHRRPPPQAPPAASAARRCTPTSILTSPPPSHPPTHPCRAALRQQPGQVDPATSSAQLLFQDSDRQGTFAFGGRQYPVTVLNLPSVVESYKTLDDVNLVKTTDIGQVRVRPGG